MPAPPASAFGDDDEDYARVSKQQKDAEKKASKPDKDDMKTNFGTATFSKAPKGFEAMVNIHACLITFVLSRFSTDIV